LKALASAAADPAYEALLIGPQHPLSTTLRIAERLLAGTLAGAQGDVDAAIAALQQGVQLEDAAAYFEPPLWHSPVRQTLGAVLLDAGRAAEAEAVYREDLRRYPENGWSLLGLAQSLLIQGRTEEAEETMRRYSRAWRHADVELVASRL
jgi:tetratricopeptide (TPR) repeat protein